MSSEEERTESAQNHDSGPPVVENRDAGRFERRVDAEVVSFATYRERDGVVVIPHVETAANHRGEGRAGELMAGIVAILEEDGRRLLPLCPYAASYVRNRPEIQHLVARRAEGR